MTQNQLEYNKLLETKRNNFEIERLTRARDRANYELGSRTASENERHNRATEQLSVNTLAETKRHNIATENYQVLSLNEQQRHNKVTEAETERSNRVREQETRRSNLAREAETARANRASESLQLRSINNMREYQQSSLKLQASQQAETQRSNLAREQETARANKAQEALAAQRNTEQSRANQAQESIRRQSNEVQIRHLGLEQAKVEIQKQEQRVRQASSPAGIALSLYDTITDAYSRTTKQSRVNNLKTILGLNVPKRTVPVSKKPTVQPTLGWRQ